MAHSLASEFGRLAETSLDRHHPGGTQVETRDGSSTIARDEVDVAGIPVWDASLAWENFFESRLQLHWW